MSKLVLKAQDLDGYLAETDLQNLEKMDALYEGASRIFYKLENAGGKRDGLHDELILAYNKMGLLMQDICKKEDQIKVYSFETASENHGEASRLIAKLRDIKTGQEEFIYYIQRAYELLFKLAFARPGSSKKNHLLVKTPVNIPVRNFAVHKIPDIDDAIENSLMCVMLRAALLPSMIMSKEIEEYSGKGYISPFALFKINRDDSRNEDNMEYILDLDRSYFRLEELDGKDLLFADPMNATGGSLVTVIKYILDQGIKPKSIQCFNVISALKGALRTIRAVPEIKLYTLWMDPALNDLAYILPGLGDAGDRINGRDDDHDPRDMIRLVADYGAGIGRLYRNQIRIIEKTVLGR